MTTNLLTKNLVQLTVGDFSMRIPLPSDIRRFGFKRDIFSLPESFDPEKTSVREILEYASNRHNSVGITLKQVLGKEQVDLVAYNDSFMLGKRVSDSDAIEGLMYEGSLKGEQYKCLGLHVSRLLVGR